VLLTAHYDSVAAGPGAADNIAGVATILEIARIMSAEAPMGNPIIFLLSDGEEPALLGAEAFLAKHPWAAEVGVVVNLEARGTSGQSILFETTENNSWLIDVFIAHAPRPIVNSLYDEIYKFQPNHTDLTIYEMAGIPGINFGFFEDFAHYHTPLDNLTNLNPGSVQHQGDNALAAVRAFAELDLLHPPAGNSVSLDLLPGVILRAGTVDALVSVSMFARVVRPGHQPDPARGTDCTRATMGRGGASSGCLECDFVGVGPGGGDQPGCRRT
jgi:Zn-dependent M28 family amino/carboxypeptidase